MRARAREVVFLRFGYTAKVVAPHAWFIYNNVNNEFRARSNVQCAFVEDDEEKDSRRKLLLRETEN